MKLPKSAPYIIFALIWPAALMIAKPAFIGKVADAEAVARFILLLSYAGGVIALWMAPFKGAVTKPMLIICYLLLLIPLYSMAVMWLSCSVPALEKSCIGKVVTSEISAPQPQEGAGAPVPAQDQ